MTMPSKGTSVSYRQSNIILRSLRSFSLVDRCVSRLVVVTGFVCTCGLIDVVELTLLGSADEYCIHWVRGRMVGGVTMGVGGRVALLGRRRGVSVRTYGIRHASNKVCVLFVCRLRLRDITWALRLCRSFERSSVRRTLYRVRWACCSSAVRR